MPALRRSPVATVAALVAALAETPSIIEGLRISGELAAAASATIEPWATVRLLERAIVASVADGDALTAFGAIHALGRVQDDAADAVLVPLIRSPEPGIAGHAAWVLGSRLPDLSVVHGLVAMVAAGGFDGMVAQRTLLQWSPLTGRLVRNAIIDEIFHLGGSGPASDLGGDGEEDREGAVRRLLDTLDGDVQLPTVPRSPGPAGRGVTVVQPFLHARLDAAGSRLGAGDAGGIASLLRSLGSSLPRHPAVREVVTVTRAHPTADGWEGPTDELGAGHRLVRIRYGPAHEVAPADAWIHRVAIERELTHLAAALSGPVVWHLRMADVGTLAAAAVARRFGHRVVFTAAPDPHAPMVARQAAGELDRAGFGAADDHEHLWFRAVLVARLVADADRLVVLPRPDLTTTLRALLGIDVDHPDGRVVVIPEGVDTAALDRAEHRRTTTSAPASAVQRVCAALPAERRHLPWLMTVGRLNPMKGPHRLAEAWAGSPELRERFNVVVVGGDLVDPSAVERATMALIGCGGGEADGLVLAGQVRPDEVADLLVHAANGGVYVAASDKEEFGLAVVEALGAGLAVVAPEQGGASTYIDQGVTGLVTDTRSVPALRRAIVDVVALASDRGRSDQARAMVRADLSVSTMAERLGDLYAALVTRPSRDRAMSAFPR